MSTASAVPSGANSAAHPEARTMMRTSQLQPDVDSCTGMRSRIQLAAVKDAEGGAAAGAVREQSDV